MTWLAGSTSGWAQAAVCALILVTPVTPVGAQAPAQTPAEPAPVRVWDLSLRAFVEYDDNVELVSEDPTAGDPVDSFAPGVLATGLWRAFENLNWTAAVGATAFHKQQIDAPDFRVTGAAPNGFVEYRAFPADIPTRTRLSYGFRRNWVGGDGFSSSHDVSLSGVVLPERALEVGPSLTLSVKDFDDDGVEPGRTSRDALQVGPGLRASYSFGPRKPRVAAAYGFTRAFADGDDFDTESHGVRLSISQGVFLRDFGVPWPLPIFVSVSGGYARVDHINFRATPQREQDNYSLGVLLFAPLSAKLSADLSYA